MANESRTQAPWQATIAISIIVPIITVVGSIFGSSEYVKGRVESLRVETGTICSRENSADGSDPWTPWFNRITNSTAYVGLTKLVRFPEPFLSRPKAVLSLNLLNVKSSDKILEDFAIPFDEVDRDRLQELSVQTFIREVSKEDCVIDVGIALPAKYADALFRKLEHGANLDSAERTLPVTPSRYPRSKVREETEREFRYQQAFYHGIGTINVTWLAAAQ
jgi:hypothetical protein